MSAAAGEEPLSGAQGKGTVSEPYDQGNKQEPTPAETSGKEGTGTEPISGVQGKGTVDEPYDKGNVSANRNTHSSSIIDGILGRKGKATVIDTSTGAPPTDHQASGMVAEPGIKETAAIAKEKHDLEAHQQDAQVTEPTAKPEPEPELEKKQADPPAMAVTPASPVAAENNGMEKGKEKEEERGRGKEFESTGGVKKSERSISPGTKPDGSHAETDGDRGMGYTPPGKMGKLGAKLGFGHH